MSTTSPLLVCVPHTELYFIYSRKRKKGIDYNAEIPFEKRPALGFYDTVDESVDVPAIDFNNMRQQHLDGELRTEKEERERKKDKQKLKARKENDVPLAMLQNQEPAVKRSKLVLPEPQISDSELQQVVKLGRASEMAKEIATESGVETTDALLADYTITPSAQASSLRTPAPQSDRIRQEALNLMALTYTETPLKGGANTTLVNPDFSGVLPQSKALATPNLVLATPFKTSRDQAPGTPGGSLGFLTPSAGALVPLAGPRESSSSSGPTSVRDKLHINAEEDASVLGTPLEVKNYQRQVKSSLREGLAGLPAPRNDFEIVVPEQEESEGTVEVEGGATVEDQSDIDMRLVVELQKQRAAELRKRSQVIQRELPRPLDINTSILRPSADTQNLNEVQSAEEAVKAEMITMLHFDLLKNPTPNTPALKRTTTVGPANYLHDHPYEEFTAEDLERARALLDIEMGVVKRGMGHGELALESYSQVWEECLEQVLYLPSQNRYTRANLASKRDRLESAEFSLEQNRKFMAREAKRCGKIEKKLKILTGGYQAKAQALIKQLQETFEQIEQSHLALSTFRFLAQQEETAIPRRMESLSEDVARQTEREKQLQLRFAALKDTMGALQGQASN